MWGGGAPQTPSPGNAPLVGRFSVSWVARGLDRLTKALLSCPHNCIATSAANRTSTPRSGAQRAGVGESRRQRSGRMDLGAADRKGDLNVHAESSLVLGSGC